MPGEEYNLSPIQILKHRKNISIASDPIGTASANDRAWECGSCCRPCVFVKRLAKRLARLVRLLLAVRSLAISVDRAGRANLSQRQNIRWLSLSHPPYAKQPLRGIAAQATDRQTGRLAISITASAAADSGGAGTSRKLADRIQLQHNSLIRHHKRLRKQSNQSIGK